MAQIPPGTISASGNVTLNGTTVIKLNGSGTNDLIQAGGDITYGGTLNLVNISGSPLDGRATVSTFSMRQSYSGSFGNITPASPGAGPGVGHEPIEQRVVERGDR